MSEAPAQKTSTEAADAPAGLSKFGWQLMQAEDRRFTLRNLKLIAVMAAGMVSLFAILDHFAYPEYQALFVSLRWTCASIIMILLLMVRSRMGKRFFKFFTVILPLVPAFFVSIMIFVTQDPASIYYAGLSLCIVAIGFLFHWTYREAFAVSGLVLVFYLVACSPAIANGLTPKDGAGLFINLVFLVTTGVVVVAGSFAHQQIRVEMFRGREKLRQQKIVLRQNARKLQVTLDELRKTEGRLIQSGKMASLGQLSAGVIHEIGNPLNYSNQALFLLRRRLRQFPEDDTISEAVEDIQDSVDRMKEIVRELREFSHKRSEVLGEFPVRDSIDVAVRMLGKEIDDHGVSVEVRIDYAVLVRGVKNQLAQVFINLLHNAVQAMSNVATDRRNLIVVSASQTEDQIEVCVHDNGPGIPDKIRSEIFDPFFTTKDAGEGTGLGLSICFRIIEAHRGTIQVFSDGATYTEFRVTLPTPQDPSDDATAVDAIAHHALSLRSPNPDAPSSPIVPALHENPIS
jgi:two-component system sensor histidine kinase PhcS